MMTELNRNLPKDHFDANMLGAFSTSDEPHRLIKDDKVEFRWLRRKETNDVLLSMAPFMH
ncbi:MAG: hypothetical protein LKE61_04220 [Erysipelotrichaceae bacterium]|jgi:hypothetical protein|uniref:hypothetical protein n=1 Tax=Lactimicrobium massiliense TaxID=2161814 RepID=UPI000D55602A|nr:hypothetical protein [Lactimicrobium massiliense]MCH4020063.1 hypothetical protein [Erysipelotrichaceae bacterium]MCI1326634.1 hypothetical protein [Solobacterium sp.]MCH4044942.1 hypothetical protein [Erysipelotrichaceae bacterium]MCH4122154.1 hypothetical protein [Erysipelotrichaceae bacterium]MCI1463295.1 hypothetical protein [Solobacterium sp.]